ncbi:MAG: hypothetical protein KKH41_01335 [Candidatus Thermoplasmatota archaeon]|nr:hypothetical protein [Euryarchaeota archaeon]MBU4031560.1 hypothetical protein [Candidatus Thermoplasmatota archaeon]MBU4071317.1 hypothetical protein [Candidatus Thermoplasmatota archaeon]MBU4143378.1 hypothetical protein [Candidatus Thermoplasmatota archaeon]MBU4591204.1 hypothetical protein [Candidatus Thermoplasmatota archaeon]
MRNNNLVILMACFAITAMLTIPTVGVIGNDEIGTRAGEVGWQYDTFSQNILVEVAPEVITTSDQIIVTITSKIPDVWIKQAAVFGVVYPEDSVQFPFSLPFQKKTDTVFECILEPFPLNGYRIDFYIVAYDYFFTQMDSKSSMSFTYDVQGSGWRHDSFDENIFMEYWPLRANATEGVVITLRSVENVTISGANLYVIYETAEGDSREGGWNFSKTNVNSTEMRRTIPGYPAGTNVTFYVTAWDQYNALVTSRMYNYSVMGIAEYTNFPFEYTDSGGNKNVWIPDDAILVPMAGVSALVIPLFIYLYAINQRRKKRAVDLIKAKQAPKEEVAQDE